MSTPPASDPTCAQCGDSLSIRGSYFERPNDGAALCRNCVLNETGKCVVCEKSLFRETEIARLPDGTCAHTECLKCKHCRKKLEQSFHAKKDLCLVSDKTQIGDGEFLCQNCALKFRQLELRLKYRIHGFSGGVAIEDAFADLKDKDKGLAFVRTTQLEQEWADKNNNSDGKMNNGNNNNIGGRVTLTDFSLVSDRPSSATSMSMKELGADEDVRLSARMVETLVASGFSAPKKVAALPDRRPSLAGATGGTRFSTRSSSNFSPERNQYQDTSVLKEGNAAVKLPERRPSLTKRRSSSPSGAAQSTSQRKSALLKNDASVKMPERRPSLAKRGPPTRRSRGASGNGSENQLVDPRKSTSVPTPEKILVENGNTQDEQASEIKPPASPAPKMTMKPESPPASPLAQVNTDSPRRISTFAKAPGSIAIAETQPALALQPEDSKPAETSQQEDSKTPKQEKPASPTSAAPVKLKQATAKASMSRTEIADTPVVSPSSPGAAALVVADSAVAADETKIFPAPETMNKAIDVEKLLEERETEKQETERTTPTIPPVPVPASQEPSPGSLKNANNDPSPITGEEGAPPATATESKTSANLFYHDEHAFDNNPYDGRPLFSPETTTRSVFLSPRTRRPSALTKMNLNKQVVDHATTELQSKKDKVNDKGMILKRVKKQLSSSAKMRSSTFSRELVQGQSGVQRHSSTPSNLLYTAPGVLAATIEELEHIEIEITTGSTTI
ncbi:unnamed protein product [Amoebophrya sp. A120]|nr:unnamed protein product [Amoebophrya sp. A120]|eukprot:GSA120T00018305001.1